MNKKMVYVRNYPQIDQRRQPEIFVWSVAGTVYFVSSMILLQAAHEDPANQPPEDWPKTGRIEFKGLSMRYRPGLELVLNDLNLSIQPGEKVGGQLAYLDASVNYAIAGPDECLSPVRWHAII